MSTYYLAAILISLTALFAFINARYIKLPNTIGLMFIFTLFSFEFSKCRIITF